VVREEDRLRGLQVRVARHDHVHIRLGKVNERRLQRAELVNNRVDLITQPKAHICRDLIIAAAAGVQALARIADLGDQRRLDVRVNIFHARSHERRPASMSFRTACRPLMIFAASALAMIPQSPSMRACATLPRMSHGASRASNETDCPKASTSACVPPSKRPPHNLLMNFRPS
jgi:hypothetical protein